MIEEFEDCCEAGRAGAWDWQLLEVPGSCSFGIRSSEPEWDQHVFTLVRTARTIPIIVSRAWTLFSSSQRELIQENRMFRLITAVCDHKSGQLRISCPKLTHSNDIGTSFSHTSIVVLGTLQTRVDEGRTSRSKLGQCFPLNHDSLKVWDCIAKQQSALA